MLPLVPAREQQNHEVRQHAGLGHGQHDGMELEDMLPLQQVIDLEWNDDMLEDNNAQPRGHGVVEVAQKVHLREPPAPQERGGGIRGMPDL